MIGLNNYKNNLQKRYLQSAKELMEENNNQYNEHIFYSLKQFYISELTNNYKSNNSWWFYLFSPQGFMFFSVLNLISFQKIGLIGLHLVISLLISEHCKLFKSPKDCFGVKEFLLTLFYPHGFMLISCLYLLFGKFDLFSLHLVITIFSSFILDSFVKMEDFIKSQNVTLLDLSFPELDRLEEKYKAMTYKEKVLNKNINTIKTEEPINTIKIEEKNYNQLLNISKYQLENDISFFSENKYLQKDLNSLFEKYSLSDIKTKVTNGFTITVKDTEELYLCIFLTYGKYKEDWNFINSIFSKNKLTVEINLPKKNKNLTITFQ